MFQSLKLGKFFGIDFYIHGTFWLLPLFVLFSGVMSGDAMTAVGGEIAFLFAVFGCVALHEVGHALAARAYGIGTRDITLYPLGGVASLEQMPEKPGREIAIALAGPAVNVVIAAALFAGLLGGSLLNPLAAVTGSAAIDAFIAKVMMANVVLAVFNLLPTFPMDGGRMRAVLATRMPRKATAPRWASVGGRAGFLVAGFLIPNFMLMAVAVVVYLLGQAELAAVRAQRPREWGTGPASGSRRPRPAPRRSPAGSRSGVGRPAACGCSTRMERGRVIDPTGA